MLIRIFLWFKDLMELKAVSKEGKRERELFEIFTGGGSGSKNDKKYW